MSAYKSPFGDVKWTIVRLPLHRRALGRVRRFLRIPQRRLPTVVEIYLGESVAARNVIYGRGVN